MDVRTLISRAAIKNSLGVAALLALAPVANAAFFDFAQVGANLEKGYSSYEQTEVGVTLTATAFEGVGSGTTPSYVYLDGPSGGPGGMGVCTNLNVGLQCDPSDDDNVSDSERLEWVLTGSDVDTVSLTFRNKDHGDFGGKINIMVGGGAFTEYTIMSGTALDLFLGSASTIKFQHVGSGLANAFYISSATFGDDGKADVPLPAGVWLLLSGLAGLLGVSRRRAA